MADALAQYRAGGFALVGTAEFPVVGRLLVLTGPGDSAWLGFAASLPPSALRFSREGALYAARYQVRLAALAAGAAADGDTVLHWDRREIVRVDAFPETASGEERVFFQHFATLPPGRFAVGVVVRELTSRREVAATDSVAWPPPGGAPSAPQPVFRAAPRVSFAQSPPLLAAPRSTAVASGPPLTILAEDPASRDGAPLVLEVVSHPGGPGREASGTAAVLWADTATPAPPAGNAGPATLLVSLPLRRLPPGRYDLRARRPGSGGRATPLLVALDDEWAAAGPEPVARYLAYAPLADEREHWMEMGPEERAAAWGRLWERTDPDPATPRNEFFAVYFDRMTEANRRYAEPGAAGWETDRGRVHVQLGPPDREVPHPPQQTGQRPELEWVYEESLPVPVRLRFADTGEFGVFRLTPRSRLALGRVLRELEALRRSGPEAG
ncbi:MAG: GWxTD domain-containing protein [Gemmatimonadota bacterium]|nr:GWxTD domain-containing protein [Gemmatimonadota bacterium]